jgi:hypothetical protein
MPDPSKWDAGGQPRSEASAFIRLSSAMAQLRAAMGYLGIDHAQVVVGIVDQGDNRQRLIDALPMSHRPSVNRQRAEVVELDGISIQAMKPRSKVDA